jgi:hypothetical protein
MADDLPRSETFGTVYRVIYDDGLRAFFTEADYTQGRVMADDILATDAFREARFEYHDGGWWMLTGLNTDGRRVDLADTTEPELDTLTLPPAVARQLGFAEVTMTRGDTNIQAESGDEFDPNLDPHLGQQTWVRFTMPNGQQWLRAAPDVTDADWDGASEVDVFSNAAWARLANVGWQLYGTKENGQRLPISVIDGGAWPARDDCDEHYDPETGTASVQAEYGDRPDLGDAEAASPTERGRIQALADRIRAWFQRDQDHGIGL